MAATSATMAPFAAVTALAWAITHPSDHAREDTPLLAITGEAITLEDRPRNRIPGIYGLSVHAGRGIYVIGPPRPGSAQGSIIRPILSRQGHTTGTEARARFTGRTLTTPAAAGLTRTALCGIAVWHTTYRPGTWALHLHGIGATAAAIARAVPDIPADTHLVPESAPGPFTWGHRETAQVLRLAAYARAHGATRIVAIGWSAGALAALAAAETQSVDAAIGISPVTNARAVAHRALRTAHVPGLIATAAQCLAATVYGFTWTDHGRTGTGPLPVPVLVLHGDGDRIVPVQHTQRFAHRGGDITVKIFDDAPHTLEWNRNRSKFQESVCRWWDAHDLSKEQSQSGHPPRRSRSV